MNRTLNVLLSLGIFTYLIVWIATIQHWLPYGKECYVISSIFIVFIASIKHFSSKHVSSKNSLLLVIMANYFAFTILAKYNIYGFSIVPLLLLVGAASLFIIELFDWMKGKPKGQKMNLIQLFTLFFFILMLLFKMQHFVGAVIPMVLFHFSLLGVAIGFLVKQEE